MNKPTHCLVIKDYDGRQTDLYGLQSGLEEIQERWVAWYASGGKVTEPQNLLRVSAACKSTQLPTMSIDPSSKCKDWPAISFVMPMADIGSMSIVDVTE